METLENFTQNQIYTLGLLLVDASITQENIEMVGYNDTSGNVWVALESGVVLYEFEGRAVPSYMVTNMDTGEEMSFDTYPEALEMILTLNK
jgi:ligand-binding sensor domain-containing protein